MSAFDFLLIACIAAGAFAFGYMVGRGSLSSGGRAPADADPPVSYDEAPLPGPASHPSSAPSRPRGSPPAASAGDRDDGGPAMTEARAGLPRRSSKPPPAAAGLMDKGEDTPRKR